MQVQIYLISWCLCQQGGGGGQVFNVQKNSRELKKIQRVGDEKCVKNEIIEIQKSIKTQKYTRQSK